MKIADVTARLKNVFGRAGQCLLTVLLGLAMLALLLQLLALVISAGAFLLLALCLTVVCFPGAWREALEFAKRRYAAEKKSETADSPSP